MSSRNAQIREVFSKNLEILVHRTKSISALCREIGVNRTQFNRYLSGEAHPRPDVLDRICRHFGYDGRLLLEPLAMIETAGAGPTPVLRPDLAMAAQEILARATTQLQPGSGLEGMYVLWRRSFSTPHRAVRFLARISSSNGITLLRYREPPMAVLTSSSTFRRSAYITYTGVCMSHPDGFSILGGIRNALPQRQEPFSMIYCERGTQGFEHIFSGTMVLTRRCGTHMSRTVSIVFERLPQDLGTWLKFARLPCFVEMSKVPDVIRHYVDQIPPEV